MSGKCFPPLGITCREIISSGTRKAVRSYLELLPTDLANKVDDYSSINAWRYSGRLTRVPFVEGMRAYAFQRAVLADGTDVCLRTQHMPNLTQSLQDVIILTARQVSVNRYSGTEYRDPVLLVWDDEYVATLTVYGESIAERREPNAIKSTLTFGNAHSRDWILLGSQFLRLPHLDRVLIVPSVVLREGQENWQVFGSEGSEKLAIVLREGLHTRAEVWNLCTGERVWSIASTEGVSSWSFSVELGVAVAEIRHRCHTRIYSLADGSRLADVDFVGFTAFSHCLIGHDKHGVYRWQPQQKDEYWKYIGFKYHLGSPGGFVFTKEVPPEDGKAAYLFCETPSGNAAIVLESGVVSHAHFFSGAVCYGSSGKNTECFCMVSLPPPDPDSGILPPLMQSRVLYTSYSPCLVVSIRPSGSTAHGPLFSINHELYMIGRDLVAAP